MKHLFSLKLERNKFTQEHCKRLHKRIKGVEGFSHRENRVFYFYCTELDWCIMQRSIIALNNKLGNEYSIK